MLTLKASFNNGNSSWRFSSRCQYSNTCIFLIIVRWIGNRPSSDLIAKLVLFWFTPRMYLQSFMCRDSHSRLLYICSKERSGCRLIFADRGLKVPPSSDPYNSIGWIVWSNTFKLVFIDGQKERKSFVV